MLYIAINDADPTPVYRQVVNQLRDHIASGSLEPGDKVPSVRELARFLDINVNTVQKAYQELKAMELITIRPARGARVSGRANEILGSRKNERLLKEAARKLLREAHRLGFNREQVLGVLGNLPPAT